MRTLKFQINEMKDLCKVKFGENCYQNSCAYIAEYISLLKSNGYSISDIVDDFMYDLIPMTESINSYADWTLKIKFWIDQLKLDKNK